MQKSEDGSWLPLRSHRTGIEGLQPPQSQIPQIPDNLCPNLNTRTLPILDGCSQPPGAVGLGGALAHMWFQLLRLSALLSSYLEDE